MTLSFLIAVLTNGSPADPITLLQVKRLHKRVNLCFKSYTFSNPRMYKNMILIARNQIAWSIQLGNTYPKRGVVVP